MNPNLILPDASLLVAGVDEAGRGPLIGSVVTAAVILNPDQPIAGLNDSKKLSEKKRELLFAQIQQHALAWCIAEATHEEIDQFNILQATMLAMKRAIEGLVITPGTALIDGNRCPDTDIACRAIVGGDGLEQSIGAASILAKVTRDRQLQELDRQYPQYGLAKHKGYPTKAHLEAIALHGILPEHRKSYGPVKKYCEATSF
ncbi:ribonuclease HII [Alkanindiges illinoisensis]|uniref:ribonuclease HII n=1 Tax=Alkanindiges illinoisensis TaxID=197183 RepID=UPI00047CFA76|nr:ribonuclease HII [Alkanindiges illinoisensis]